MLELHPESTKAAPKHLTRESKALWKSIASEYELQPHHYLVLRAALESWDRCQEARALVSVEGLTTTDARGRHLPHPAVVIERDSRGAFLRALRELGLDLESADPNRLPSIAGRAR